MIRDYLRLCLFNHVGTNVVYTEELRMLDVVDLSRLQFALTALYHFIFRATDIRFVIRPCDYGNHLCGDRQRSL